MKKILTISMAAVFVCAIISITASSLSVNPKQAENENKISESQWQQEYVIKEYKGLVAVFKSGGEIPVKITQTRVDTLPPYDAQMLKEGIAAENEEKLEKMLMDFCS